MSKDTDMLTTAVTRMFVLVQSHQMTTQEVDISKLTLNQLLFLGQVETHETFMDI